MKAEELRALVCRKPFQPFRIRLKDGQSFDIPDPNCALVGESVVIVGVRAVDDPTGLIPDRSVWVWLSQIDGLELLQESPVPTG
jgi:hypothetical protein